jgi:hypothetical protein
MSLKDTATFGNIPSCFKTGTLYSIQPLGGGMDLAYTGPNTNRMDSMGALKNVFENIPPLGYDLANGEVYGFPECRLEISRTNYMRYSTNFDNSTYWQYGDVSNNHNVTDSVNVTGVFGVNKFFANSNNSEHLLRQTINLLTSGRTYWFSIYIKPVGTDAISVQSFNATAGTAETAVFNFTAQTINKTDAEISADEARMEKLPNGWFRISCKFTATASTTTFTMRFMQYIGGVLNQTYIGNNQTGFLLYGGQFEGGINQAATDPTAHIPTTTGAQTRNAPTLISPDYSNFPSNYPITMYWEGRIDRYSTTQHVWSLFNNANNQIYITLDFNSDTDIKIRRKGLSTGTAIEYVGTANYRTTKNDYLKIIVVFYNDTDYSIFINGFLVESFSGSSVLYKADTIRVGCGKAQSNDTGKRQSFKQVFLWSKGFTNDEALTATSYSSFEDMAKSMNFKTA